MLAYAAESLSEILCVRHNMLQRSMYAKQDPKEEAGSGAADYPERNHHPDSGEPNDCY